MKDSVTVYPNSAMRYLNAFFNVQTSGHVWTHPIVAYLLLFTAHLVAARIGVFIYVDIAPAIVWLSAGIALAGLTLGGKKLWPAVTLASLTNALFLGQPIIVALALSVGGTAQAYMAVVMLERFQFNPRMAKLRDTVVFLTVTLLASALGPLIITSALFYAGILDPTAFSPTFGRWWAASSVSFIVFGGFLIRWLSRPIFHRTSWEWIEGTLSIVLATAIAFVLTWTDFTNLFGVSLVYILLAPFFWAAFRVGPRGMTLALLSVTLVFLTGVTLSPWTDAQASSVAERVVSTEILAVVWAFMFLLLVSVAEERKVAIKAFADHVDQLEDIIKRVSADAQVKTEFLAILAHELRNPLAPLLSAIELMKHKGSDPRERLTILGAMEDRVQTMGRLLDDLLDISRITRRKLKLQRQVVDVRDVIRRAIENVEPVIQHKHHTLTVSTPDHPLYVEVDPVRLEQIVVNLVGNATKYTNDGGYIWVSVRRKGEEMILTVKDTGVGISNEMADLIFEPFLQLPQEHNRPGSGLGIGLSLTKRLVELHKGTISVTSEGLNTGAEFTVKLPAPSHVQLPIPKTDDAVGKTSTLENGRSLRVLVVDDNEAAANGLRELLKIKGHNVWVESDGESTLRASKEFNPHAIVLDIGLPDMSGYEVAEKLRSDGSKAMLIALTGYGQDEDKMRAERAGFDRHLTKPIGIAELEHELQHVTVGTT